VVGVRSPAYPPQAEVITRTSIMSGVFLGGLFVVGFVRWLWCWVGIVFGGVGFYVWLLGSPAA